jgi:putative transposase
MDIQIIALLKEAEVGTQVSELCRTHGNSSATFYRWRPEFGGMETSLMALVKELERDNRRLKKLYVDAQVYCGGLSQKMVMPAQRRALAQYVVNTKRTTIQHAYRTFGISETRYRH